MADFDILKLDYPVYEGIGLPKMRNFLENAGQTIQNIKDLKLGPDAVILATFPRSGTHWVYEIAHMLLTKKAEYATKSREAVYLEGLPDLGPLQSYNHIVSTHLPFQWLPQQHVERGGKIIHIIRNPKDVAVSLYKFTDSCDEVMFGGWFNYNKAFIRESEVRKDQIIMLQYEKLQRNTIWELKRLAKFLDVKDADPLFPEIAEKCGFDNLKAADERVRNDSTMAEIIKSMNLKKIPTLYRKGKVGDWKNYFTVAMNETFDKIYADTMKNVAIDIDFV
ncbi:sulfotransferase 1E1-like isoform X2 [Crassostrea angulata]|uniref:sulfotransferase 1E1-like isoform X2 n=1 Tax=Magallana angulata TaxID=2784310 RepID=UPI0022B0D569|nr:sulfotransferase 1E1-like isoform X2 [Crassostrea angulata]